MLAGNFIVSGYPVELPRFAIVEDDDAELLERFTDTKLDCDLATYLFANTEVFTDNEGLVLRDDYCVDIWKKFPDGRLPNPRRAMKRYARRFTDEKERRDSLVGYLARHGRFAELRFLVVEMGLDPHALQSNDESNLLEMCAVEHGWVLHSGSRRMCEWLMRRGVTFDARRLNALFKSYTLLGRLGAHDETAQWLTEYPILFRACMRAANALRGIKLFQRSILLHRVPKDVMGLIARAVEKTRSDWTSCNWPSFYVSLEQGPAQSVVRSNQLKKFRDDDISGLKRRKQ